MVHSILCCRYVRGRGGFTTPAENPTSTPGNVRLATSPGSVSVSWQPSSSPIGIANYEVTLVDDFRTKRVTTADTSAEFAVPNGGDVDVTVRARDTAEIGRAHV